MASPANWCLVALIISISKSSFTLRISSIDVPVFVLTGERTRLGCHFDLEGENLYSLTWWKDSSPFFRFIASNNGMTFYKIPGLEVDEYGSSIQTLILSRVDHRASGTFRCEILADGSFQKDSMSSNMTVVVRPRYGPNITGIKPTRSYKEGELLLLFCTSSPAFPPCRLTWKVNGRKIVGTAYETVIKYPLEQAKNGLLTSRSGLQIVLQESHFLNGNMLIRCSSSLMHLQLQYTEVLLLTFNSDSNRQTRSDSQSSEEGSGGLLKSSSLVMTILYLMRSFFHIFLCTA